LCCQATKKTLPGLPVNWINSFRPDAHAAGPLFCLSYPGDQRKGNLSIVGCSAFGNRYVPLQNNASYHTPNLKANGSGTFQGDPTKKKKKSKKKKTNLNAKFIWHFPGPPNKKKKKKKKKEKNVGLGPPNPNYEMAQLTKPFLFWRGTSGALSQPKDSVQVIQNNGEGARSHGEFNISISGWFLYSFSCYRTPGRRPSAISRPKAICTPYAA